MKTNSTTSTIHPSRDLRPKSRSQLRGWVRENLQINLPNHGACPEHDSPLDYLDHAFFERDTTADTVVWACRGGGKTMIGAVATLLDLLFKPGIQIRILGGSRDQSEKMYIYLCDLVRERFADRLDGKLSRRGFKLDNGSKVEILTQSQTAVRGTRVQKMRCDEVELFNTEVWKAAQLTTRTLLSDDKPATENDARPIVARGAVEVFSTMHRPAGLMAELVGREGENQKPAGRRRVFRWCIWDVVGKCLVKSRACAGCELLPECASRARKATGFVPIVDILAFHQRATRRSWQNEMLCHVPQPDNQVFPAFDSDAHIRNFPLQNPSTSTCFSDAGRGYRVESVIAGIDYGWKKFVCLWLAMLRDTKNRRVAWAFDEYAHEEKELDGHIAAMLERRDPSFTVFYADVAGRQHDAHSGKTSESVLKDAGLAIKSRAMHIDVGIAAIDRLIDPPESWGHTQKTPRFFVDPRCKQLILALKNYTQKNGEPVKDGAHDHLIDALRYAIAGHDGTTGNIAIRKY